MVSSVNHPALIGMGLGAGFAAKALAQSASQGNAVSKVATPAMAAADARYHVPFATIGLDHAHIYAMTDALIRGGGAPTAFHAADPAQIAPFRKRYGGVPPARSEAEIMDGRAIRIVAGAPVPDLRAPLGIRAMRAGKDFLGDPPANRRDRRGRKGPASSRSVCPSLIFEVAHPGSRS